MSALICLATLVLTGGHAMQKEVEPKVVTASLFKNGYAVLVREVAVAGAGTYLLNELPSGSLGTLWIGASGNLKVEEAVNTSVVTESKASLGNFDEILRANIGKRLVFSLNRPAMTRYEGKLAAVMSDSVLLEDVKNVLNPALGAEAGKAVVVMKNQIEGLESGEALIYQRDIKSERRLMRVKVGGSGGGNLILLSLESGVTWAPSYMVDISDDKKLTVTSKATILNDRLELDGVDVRLVTGFPNLPYRQYQDPLVFQGAVEQFIQLLAGLSGAADMAAAPGMMTQNAMRREAFSAGAFGGGQPVAGTDFEQSEDLFFYKRPGVTLRRGDRGAYVLFRSEAPYRHLFTLDIPDSFERLATSQGVAVAPDDPEVWNTLRWENKAGLPLTTGPAITIQNGSILGQDIINYTPNGAETLLRITKALEIRPEVVEEEVSRERGALKVPNSSMTYDLVTVKTTIELKNGKGEAVSMRVKMDRTGEQPSADQTAQFRTTVKGLRDVNSRFQMTWEPKIEPGKSLTIAVTYRVYVPSRGF